MKKHPLPEKVIGIDVVGLFPQIVRGYEYIVNIIDLSSRFAHAVPRQKPNALIVIIVLKGWISVLGQFELVVLHKIQSFKSLRMFKTGTRSRINQRKESMLRFTK